MTIDVRLRLVEERDLHIFFEQQRDPDAVRMAAFTHKDPTDRAVFNAHWTKIRGDPRNGRDSGGGMGVERMAGCAVLAMAAIDAKPTMRRRRSQGMLNTMMSAKYTR